MEPTSTHRVVGVHAIGGGIFVQFSSGETALYSAALLHSVLDRAFVPRGGNAQMELPREASRSMRAES